MRKMLLAVVPVLLISGCASLSDQALDATSRDLRVHPDEIEIHNTRISGLNMEGRTRVAWRAWVNDVAYDCSGYHIEESTCLESPDQSPKPTEE